MARTPFHRDLQRRIILTALDRIMQAPESGDIHALPVTWAQARREGLAIEQEEGRQR